MTADFSRIRAVAFDLDGTLVDSLPDLAAAADAVRASLGKVRLPEEMYRSFLGDGMMQLVRRVVETDGDTADDGTLQRAAEIFMRHYAAHLTGHTRAYPQVGETLSALKARQLPLAVITNKLEKFAVEILRALDLADSFSFIAGADTLPEKKPSPLPLLHTCAIFGIEPQELLMVGDSRNDILAARAAGAPVVLAAFGYGGAEDLQKNPETRADAVIRRMDGLCALLEND